MPSCAVNEMKESTLLECEMDPVVSKENSEVEVKPNNPLPSEKDVHRLQASSLNPHQRNQSIEFQLDQLHKELAAEQRDEDESSLDDDTDSLDTVKQDEEEGISEEMPMQSVIVFDWDDTLLASSFLFSKGLRLDTEVTCPEVIEALKELEVSVCNVLELAMNCGRVVVITNAETGWVQLSARKFLPGVLPLLEKVYVLSARSTYEFMFPNAPLKWKFCAFQESLSELFKYKGMKNVISFGDSHVEREAVRAVTRGLENVKTKSVKFAERPSMEQLRRQIELVANSFQYIHSHDGDLDLMLTISLL